MFDAFADRPEGEQQHLVFGLEVVLDPAHRHTRLGGDVAQADPLEPAGRRQSAHRRGDLLTAFVMVNLFRHIHLSTYGNAIALP
ncbi:hypothetical protein GCM10023319_81410 [Nocardia iowensis]